jgi:hypothetical protein
MLILYLSIHLHLDVIHKVSNFFIIKHQNSTRDCYGWHFNVIVQGVLVSRKGLYVSTFVLGITIEIKKNNF